MSEISHAEASRTLLSAAGLGALATHAAHHEGFPYSSLVQFATAENGDPLFLVSELAEHTQNLREDGRASLLIWQGRRGVDPLAAPRVTLFGVVELDPDPEKLELYLTRHPQARQYVGFMDFKLWRLEVERARYVGGFGAMSWLTAEAYRAAQPDPVEKLADGIISHMNEDHADALIQIVQHKLNRTVESALMVDCDGAGYLVRLDGKETKRISFSRRLQTSDEIRREFIAQVKEARGVLGGGAQPPLDPEARGVLGGGAGPLPDPRGVPGGGAGGE